jgi:dTDP-4-dehydrorhamnose reductase
MRILVTGASGMLGQDVVKTLQSEHEVLATGKRLDSELNSEIGKMDMTDLSEVAQVFGQFQPEGVIHCAAMTDVDGCERDPVEAYRINAHGSSLIASACTRQNAFMVYISTDYVFDGNAGRPYHEYDTPNPINVYGYSKWLGEQVVQAICPRHYVVRTAWLYGHGARCFPKIIFEAAKAGRPLRVVKDQTGSPTFTQDLAQAIAQLIQIPAYGTYHLVNQGAVSWHTFAKKVLALAGIDMPVEAIRTKEWSSPTHRPAYSALISLRTGWLGLPSMRTFEEALEEWGKKLSK